MQTSSKRNEHPACSCRACVRGRHTPGGHFTTTQVNKKIRRMAKQAIKRGDDNVAIVSTPYTD
jgi:hypothetical protein